MKEGRREEDCKKNVRKDIVQGEGQMDRRRTERRLERKGVGC